MPFKAFSKRASVRIYREFMLWDSVSKNAEFINRGAQKCEHLKGLGIGYHGDEERTDQLEMADVLGKLANS